MGVHPSASVSDALLQLDSSSLLLHKERLLIVQSLWDAAFREGETQGRKAGTESVQNKLRLVAAETGDTYIRDLLTALAASYDDPRSEYQDPTRAIRERLANLARRRTTDNFTAPYPER